MICRTADFSSSLPSPSCSRAALGVFGARALIQERQLVDQQIRERLETAAGIVSRDLEPQFQEWQLALDRLGQAPRQSR